MSEDKEITIALKREDAQALLDYLGTRPYNEVAKLISTIVTAPTVVIEGQKEKEK